MPLQKRLGRWRQDAPFSSYTKAPGSELPPQSFFPFLSLYLLRDDKTHLFLSAQNHLAATYRRNPAPPSSGNACYQATTRTFFFIYKLCLFFFKPHQPLHPFVAIISIVARIASNTHNRHPPSIASSLTYHSHQQTREISRSRPCTPLPWSPPPTTRPEGGMGSPGPPSANPASAEADDDRPEPAPRERQGENPERKKRRTNYH